LAAKPQVTGPGRNGHDPEKTNPLALVKTGAAEKTNPLALGADIQGFCLFARPSGTGMQRIRFLLRLSADRPACSELKRSRGPRRAILERRNDYANAVGSGSRAVSRPGSLPPERTRMGRPRLPWAHHSATPPAPGFPDGNAHRGGTGPRRTVRGYLPPADSFAASLPKCGRARSVLTRARCGLRPSQAEDLPAALRCGGLARGARAHSGPPKARTWNPDLLASDHFGRRDRRTRRPLDRRPRRDH
jgi:hypothetical protein